MDESDLDKTFQLPSTTFIGGQEAVHPLKEIIERLEVGKGSFCTIYVYIYIKSTPKVLKQQGQFICLGFRSKVEYETIDHNFSFHFLIIYTYSHTHPHDIPS